jgi:hypothetical protein
MNKPFPVDFIGIGAARSGTSWLANCLRRHPEICVSEPKEIRYFNYQNFPNPVGPDNEITRAVNGNYSRPASWYMKHFEHCRGHKVIGEISPIYLFDEKAPLRIKECCPDVKIIVSLRNPIDRAFSHYGMIYGAFKGRLVSFDEAVKRHSIFIEMGMYARQLKRYWERFDRGRIGVLLFDDLVGNPIEELKKVFKFLEVSTEFDPDIINNDTNPSRAQRSVSARRLHYRASRMLIGMKMGSFLHRLRNMGVHQWVNRANRKPLVLDEMRPETRRYLRSAFKRDIDELQTLIGRDLSAWQ